MIHTYTFTQSEKTHEKKTYRSHLENTFMGVNMVALWRHVHKIWELFICSIKMMLKAAILPNTEQKSFQFHVIPTIKSLAMSVRRGPLVSSTLFLLQVIYTTTTFPFRFGMKTSIYPFYETTHLSFGNRWEPKICLNVNAKFCNGVIFQRVNNC